MVVKKAQEMIRLQDPSSPVGIKLEHQMLRAPLILFEPEDHITLLKKQIGGLVQNTFTLQISVWGLSLLATHLGVPIIFTAPGAAASFAAS